MYTCTLIPHVLFHVNYFPRGRSFPFSIICLSIYSHLLHTFQTIFPTGFLSIEWGKKSIFPLTTHFIFSIDKNCPLSRIFSQISLFLFSKMSPTINSRKISHGKLEKSRQKLVNKREQSKYKTGFKKTA